MILCHLRARPLGVHRSGNQQAPKVEPDKAISGENAMITRPARPLGSLVNGLVITLVPTVIAAATSPRMSVTAHPVRCRRLLLVVLLSAMMALAACGESTQASGKAGTKNTPTSGNVSGNGTPTSGNVDSGGSSGALVWSAPITIDSNGQSSFSVSCSSANFCAAVHTSQDANGNGEATTYNGNFWAALTVCRW